MPKRTDPGRKQVFNNIDYEQNVHYMTENQKHNIHHWPAYMSTEIRMPGNHLPEDKPQCDFVDKVSGIRGRDLP